MEAIPVTLSAPLDISVDPKGDFPVDIQAEASSYFQNVHAGVLTLDDAVRLLERFSKSREPREKKIFTCMAKRLFDDYKFFPRCPESDLKITAVLFGSLIKHDLLSAVEAEYAKEFVHQAVMYPVDSTIFLLGVLTLEQLMDMMGETMFWYFILNRSKLQQGRGDIVESILRALAKRRSSLSWKIAEFIVESKSAFWIYLKISEYFIKFAESFTVESNILKKS